MATTTAATTGSNSCLRKTTVAAATAKMNDKLDSTIWLEWVTEHRGMSTTNLLDPYVDPAAEKHMTIPKSTLTAAEPPLPLHQRDDTTHVGMRMADADAQSSPKQHCSDNEQRLYEGKRCRTPTSSRRYPSSPNRRSEAADDTSAKTATKAVQDIVVSPRIDHDGALAPYPSSANPDDASFVTSPRYKTRSKNRRIGANSGGGDASGNCSVASVSTTGGGSMGTTRTSRSAPAAASTANHHRDIKWRCWHASYPEVTDVEKALDGCNVSQVLQPWQQHNNPSQGNNVVAQSSTTSSDTHSALMDLERAMETFHISIPSMASTSMGTTGEHSHEQQQQQQPTRNSPRRSLSTAPALPPSPRPPLHPRAPSGGSLYSQTVPTATTGAQAAADPASNGHNITIDDESGLDDSNNPQPEPLLRLSTSTIISQQNAIWEQIQLERQEHLVGFSSVPAPAPQPQPANDASTINATISRPMERGISRRTITRQRSSNRRTHQERSSSTELDSSRHSRNGRSALPSTTPPSGNLATTSTTASAPRETPVYRYTKNPRPRDGFSLHSGSTRPSERSPTSSIASSDASASTAAVAAAAASALSSLPVLNSDDANVNDNAHQGDDDEIVTVPCLECEAPLHLPTRPDATKLVVYCPVCGTMASSELMRSLIGTTNTSSSENVQAAPKEVMPPGRVTL